MSKSNKGYNQHIDELTVEEKLKLFDKSIWRKSECCAFLGFQKPAMTIIFKKIKRETPFPNSVYRDEFLELIGTTADKEIRILKLLKHDDFKDKKEKWKNNRYK